MLLAERAIEERQTQLSIAIAGSGWSGEQAKDLFNTFDDARKQIAEQLEGERPAGEPKTQIALSEEEFRRQVGA